MPTGAAKAAIREMRVRGALGRHDGSHYGCDACDLAEELRRNRAAAMMDLTPEPCEAHGDPYCDCDK